MSSFTRLFSRSGALRQPVCATRSAHHLIQKSQNYSSSAQSQFLRRRPLTSAHYTRGEHVRGYASEAPRHLGSFPLKPERKPWRAAPHRRADEPVYELYFTCKACKHRSGHSISKQGYHHGTVLVQCPGCNNRHLISDHLKIFYDRSVTLEDLMKEKGEAIKLGNLNEKGDVEFWNKDAADAAETKEDPPSQP